MQIKQGLEKEYQEYVAKNTDDYGSACVRAGERVGALLDEGKTPEEAEKGLHGDGLSGFMAGAAISGVVHFHPRGEELKAWWNKTVSGEPDDMSGTNNPAIITIGKSNMEPETQTAPAVEEVVVPVTPTEPQE